MPNTLVSGEVHDFVARWIGVILTNINLRDAHGAKDWRLLESLSAEGLENYRAEGEVPSNVISFHVNRKTHPRVAQSNRDIYRLINKTVVEHCLPPTILSLPGFYAFLRSITGTQKSYPDAFENDPRLTAACNDLITGYWEAVQPSLHSVEFDQSADKTADMTALNGIQHIAEEANSEKSNQLSAQPPFKKALGRVQEQIQSLSIKSTPIPTLTR